MESLAAGLEQEKEVKTQPCPGPQSLGPAPVGTGSAPGAAPSGWTGGLPGPWLFAGLFVPVRPRLLRVPRCPGEHSAAEAQDESRAASARRSRVAGRNAAPRAILRSPRRAPFFERISRPGNKPTCKWTPDPRLPGCSLRDHNCNQRTGSESARESVWKKKSRTTSRAPCLYWNYSPAPAHTPLAQSTRPHGSPAHPGRGGPITAQRTAPNAPDRPTRPQELTPAARSPPAALPRCCGGRGTPARRRLPALAGLSPKASVSSRVHLPGAVCAVACVFIYLCTTCKYPPDSLHSIY